MTLYLSDLDGTLLNYAAKLKPRAAEMLNRMIKKGVLFSYATARGFHTSRKITAALNLQLPLITMNGAIICEPDTGKPIVNNSMNRNDIKTAFSFFKENKETPLVYSFIGEREMVGFIETDTGSIGGYLSSRKGDERFRPCKYYDELNEGDIFYFTLISPKSDVNMLKNVFSAQNGFSCVYYKDVYSDDYWFEIFKAGVSKAAALREVKRLTGADKVVAFGDNLNDIAMFETADECYAVENAHPELKKIADGIIRSNEEMGVPVFVEKHTVKIWDYNHRPLKKEPDKNRFNAAVKTALRNESEGIGTLNEKHIHSALKNYFSENPDREAKIGSFIADAAGENGVYEIQTANWNKLNKKLDVFLDVCHVTVVYPFEQRVHNVRINEITGEVLNPSVRNNKDLSRFFLELYRIKSFLTHPNLTVCLAGLEIEKIIFTDPDNPRKRVRSSRQEKIKKPISIISEIYLNNRKDYREFLPENLPKTFTKKQFRAVSGTRDASVMLEILEYVSVVHKCGKAGNSFVYSADYNCG